MGRKAFISYAWESREHKRWVRELATRLRDAGITVRLDQGETTPGQDLTTYMERAIVEADYVLVICTPGYLEKGGVGYEGMVIRGQLLTGTNPNKFIPILRSGIWGETAPEWLKARYYLDLRGEPYSEEQYRLLLDTLLGRGPTEAISYPVIDQFQSSTRVNWRPLSDFAYQAHDDSPQLRQTFLSQLAIHLHRTFEQQGYTRFVSLVRYGNLRPVDGSEPIPCYALHTQQPRLAGELRSSLHYLWYGPEEEIEARQKHQAALGAVGQELATRWGLELQIAIRPQPMPLELTYDPEGRTLAIRPPAILSTDPTDYAEGLGTTSEILTFSCAMLATAFAIVDWSRVTSSYPLHKLILAFMDRKFRIEDIRVDDADPERWDYLNLPADQEIGNEIRRLRTSA